MKDVTNDTKVTFHSGERIRVLPWCMSAHWKASLETPVEPISCQMTAVKKVNTGRKL